MNAQRLLQGLDRAWIVPGQPPHVPQVGEGVGLADLAADLTVDAQRLLQVPGRAWIIPGRPAQVPPVMEVASLAESVADLMVKA